MVTKNKGCSLFALATALLSCKEIDGEIVWQVSYIFRSISLKHLMNHPRYPSESPTLQLCQASFHALTSHSCPRSGNMLLQPMRRAARRLSSGQFISSWRLRMKCCPLVNWSHQMLPGIGASCWSILNPYFMLVLDLPFYGKAMKACHLANLFRDESGPRCSSLWENHFPPSPRHCPDHDHSLQARKHHQLPNMRSHPLRQEMQDCHDQTASHCGHRVLVGLETSDAVKNVSTQIGM